MDRMTAFEIAESALKDALRRKCNQTFDWECRTWPDLREACCDEIRCRRISRRELAEVIDSLRVCDLTLNSGELLAASLDRLLEIRSALGILTNEEGVSIDIGLRCTENGVTVRYVGDTIYDEDIAELPDSRVRRIIFEQMKRDAEHCLFGCSADSEAVDWCRRRLMSEFEKIEVNTVGMPGGMRVLTDNIREGNGLISAVAVQVGRWPDADSASARVICGQYQTTAEACRQAADDAEKTSAKMAATEARRAFAENAYSVWSETSADGRRSGIEWMVGFPEVLNAGGAFQGFELVAAEPDSLSGRKMATDYLRQCDDPAERGKAPAVLYEEHGKRLLSEFGDKVWIVLESASAEVHAVKAAAAVS